MVVLFNKKVIFYLMVFTNVFCSDFTFGQLKWSLDSCINYALKNNLTSQELKLNVRSSELKSKSSIFNFFPTLNGSGSHGYNWGQSIDPFTNQFATDRVRTNNLYLNSNWLLFSGLQNYHLLGRNNLEYENGKINLEIHQRNLRMDLTGQYLQVILNTKQLNVTKEQINYTLLILEKIMIQIDEGQIAPYSRLEVESTLANDSLSYKKASNELDLSLVKLKQMINIESDVDFILSPVESKITLESEISLENLAEFKQMQTLESISEFQIKLAKTELLPRLTLNTSLGSGYSGNNKEIVGSEFLPKPFQIQLKENFYQSATFTLSIPIFNKGVISSIDIAKIEMEKTKVKNEQLALGLENKIVQLKTELNNAYSEYAYSEALVTSLQKSYDVALLRLEERDIPIIELLELQKKLYVAKSNLIQSEITKRFKEKILDIYFTGN